MAMPPGTGTLAFDAERPTVVADQNVGRVGASGPVGGRATLQALAWTEYLETHARRAYASVASPELTAPKRSSKSCGVVSCNNVSPRAVFTGRDGRTSPTGSKC